MHISYIEKVKHLTTKLPPRYRQIEEDIEVYSIRQHYNKK